MNDFRDDAQTMLAGYAARRSGIEPAGGFERPAAILDWSYASSPFCAEMQAEREHYANSAYCSDFCADFAHKSFDEAANDNVRVRLVR